MGEGAYHLEGLTGPHSSMQFPKDKMEADHEPHFNLLETVGTLKHATKALFEGARLGKEGVYGQAMTIILGKARHKEGRTHSGKAPGATKDALAVIKAKRAAADADKTSQRAAVVAGLRWSMNEDVKIMRAVILDDAHWPDADKLYPKPADKAKRDDLVEKVRENIEAGLLQVQRQPLDDYLT